MSVGPRRMSAATAVTADTPKAVATPKAPKTSAVSTPKVNAVATPKVSAVATPKVSAVATPKVSAVATPKVSAVATPKVSAVPAVVNASPPEPERVSRSGRKIKPKRFLDEEEFDTPTSTTEQAEDKEKERPLPRRQSNVKQLVSDAKTPEVSILGPWTCSNTLYYQLTNYVYLQTTSIKVAAKESKSAGMILISISILKTY
jgi:hypothetical protein